MHRDTGGGRAAPRGYRGESAGMLRGADAAIGDTVSIVLRDGTTQAGILMPRYEHDDDVHVVIKLRSGYNIGIDTGAIKGISVVETAVQAAASRRDGGSENGGAPAADTAISPPSSPSSPPPAPAPAPAKKRILLLSTGGTIASRIDYRTGAVTPALSAGDLLDAVPELGQISAIDAEVLISEYSENVTPEHWLLTARRIAKLAGHGSGAARNTGKSSSSSSSAASCGYAGVVVAHGTDTMHYTSAFLSFALAGCPIPVVLVGAQRSPDRASSDAATNLVGAARFIASCHDSGTNGVYVAMHSGTDDDSIACHVGTRVRKNHTSRRDAFQTIGGDPAFVVSEDGTVTPAAADTTARGRSFYSDMPYNPVISLDRRVSLVKYHPGYDPGLLRHIIGSGCRAIIFEGTGLGHVGRTVYEQVAGASKSGIFMGMTSQCIGGRTGMTVYESGRDLMGMGVTPLADMIPEVALVKAMWASSQAADAEGIRQIMLRNVASEMTVR